MNLWLQVMVRPLDDIMPNQRHTNNLAPNSKRFYIKDYKIIVLLTLFASLKAKRLFQMAKEEISLWFDDRLELTKQLIT